MNNQWYVICNSHEAGLILSGGPLSYQDACDLCEIIETECSDLWKPGESIYLRKKENMSEAELELI